MQDGVEIQFEDNGCGMAADIMENPIDPFFTTKEVGRGSGQGLAIARSIIVDKHMGRISVESTPGAGSCFYAAIARSTRKREARGYVEVETPADSILGPAQTLFRDQFRHSTLEGVDGGDRIDRT